MYNRQIETFVFVADFGSFSKAAEKLYITTASVMNQMNSLESSIDIKLLERTNQGIKLTPSGRSFYKDAKHIIEESEKAISHAREIAKVEHHTIRVGTSLLNPGKTLIDLWDQIIGDNSNFQIKIVPFNDDRTNMLSLLSSLGKQFDFLVGACGSNLWNDCCNTYVLGKYNVACAVPRGHRLAHKKIIKITDLYGENLMMVKRGDTKPLDELRDMLEERHPQIHIINTPFFYDADVFNMCENTGDVLLTLHAWKETHPSLITLPVEWDYTVPYGLLYAKKPSRDVLAFIQLIRETL